ncbi:hypothetical protein IWW39_006241 [Coemansia spiralis]|uniref:Roadblock/LAMTOR2 domain-containing protein n=1 Tax=Coemansia spiralis TaxID=417178 RepID=A0A9W8G9D0_9FUNG|nr:hypothetical protein IWW39_006241 [Coemansia spiralis]
MLRSKNLKRILEQALTSDILVCAVFNEDGVVLAHAAVSQVLGSDFNRGDSCRRSSHHAALNDKGRQKSPFASYSGEETQQNEGDRAAAQGAERLPRKQTGVSVVAGGEPRKLHHAAQSPTAFGSSAAAQLHEDSQPTETGSCSSSLSEDQADMSLAVSMRERLEDDLAIAANLWQSYEGMPNLIERKERDVDDYIGDTASEMQDRMLENMLNMIIIECEYGKVVVTRLGVYRLFLLGKPTAALGLLKLKSDSLCRYLEEFLVGHS